MAALRAHTVSDAARAKNVLCQHIQQLADALVASGFATFAENPDHKRSPFVTLTPKGEAARHAVITYQLRHKAPTRSDALRKAAEIEEVMPGGWLRAHPQRTLELKYRQLR